MRADDSVWRGTTRSVVVSTAEGALVELVGVGALLWDLVAEARPVDAVVADLADLLEAPGPEVRRRLETLLDEVGPGVIARR